ncbi:MAG: ABC-type transport auxiliary lipoprotein family protein [Gammaproteobacteria bacterium]
MLTAGVAFLLAASVSGCSPFPNKGNSSPPVTYLLQWKPPPANQGTAPPVRCGTLLISAPRSAPGFDTARMAYVRQDYRIDYFARHRWADDPARMLRPILVEALGSSGLFRSVTADRGAVDARLRMDTDLLRLQQVFGSGGSTVELSVRVTVVDNQSGRVVYGHLFDVNEPAPSENPYGGVVAANHAVAVLMRDLVTALREHAVAADACPGRRAGQ